MIAAREIQAVLQDRNYENRAADLGLRVRGEAGTATACNLLSRLLGKSDSEEEILAQAARKVV